MSLIEKRRSIRKFLKKPVEADKLDMLLESALRSPSSMGKNPWEFVVVKEADLIEKLSTAKVFGSTFVKNAPLAIVVCADPETSDVWVEDASIASIYIHLAAESIGLGSCWVQIRNRMRDDTVTSQDYIADLLGIPENRQILALVAIGYPDEEKAPHAKDTLQFDKIYLDRYGKPY